MSNTWVISATTSPSLDFLPRQVPERTTENYQIVIFLQLCAGRSTRHLEQWLPKTQYKTIPLLSDAIEDTNYLTSQSFNSTYSLAYQKILWGSMLISIKSSLLGLSFCLSFCLSNSKELLNILGHRIKVFFKSR